MFMRAVLWNIKTPVGKASSSSVQRAKVADIIAEKLISIKYYPGHDPHVFYAPVSLFNCWKKQHTRHGPVE